jgi:hypothetical protein
MWRSRATTKATRITIPKITTNVFEAARIYFFFLRDASSP